LSPEDSGLVVSRSAYSPNSETETEPIPIGQEHPRSVSGSISRPRSISEWVEIENETVLSASHYSSMN
jgi:hypothetical protein